MLSFLGDRLLRWSRTRRGRVGNVGALGAQTAQRKSVKKLSIFKTKNIVGVPPLTAA
jgi:hypothetical protein